MQHRDCQQGRAIWSHPADHLPSRRWPIVAPPRFTPGPVALTKHHNQAADRRQPKRRRSRRVLASTLSFALSVFSARSSSETARAKNSPSESHRRCPLAVQVWRILLASRPPVGPNVAPRRETRCTWSFDEMGSVLADAVDRSQRLDLVAVEVHRAQGRCRLKVGVIACTDCL